MKRRKVYYTIQSTGFTEYDWSYSRKQWFVPEFDENGKGLPSNGRRSNMARANTLKAAQQKAIQLIVKTNKDALITKWFTKKGKRFCNDYIYSRKTNK